MTQRTSDADKTKAIQWLKAAERIVVFTGAGISVASGIPDFRGKGGLWEKYDPSECADYDNFMRNPRSFWQMCAAIDGILRAAKPNAAHRAIAGLEIGPDGNRTKQVVVMTQNIDGLHGEGGSSKVFELHGTAKTASCMACKTAIAIDTIRELMRGKTVAGTPLDPAHITIPTCPKCSSKQVKTDVVLFGEDLPRNIMSECMTAIKACDVLIMIGSSLEVSPANMLPLMAKHSGAKVIFANKDPTVMDRVADVILWGKCEDTLPPIVAAATNTCATDGATAEASTSAPRHAGGKADYSTSKATARTSILITIPTPTDMLKNPQLWARATCGMDGKIAKALKQTLKQDDGGASTRQLCQSLLHSILSVVRTKVSRIAITLAPPFGKPLCTVASPVCSSSSPQMVLWFLLDITWIDCKQTTFLSTKLHRTTRDWLLKQTYRMQAPKDGEGDYPTSRVESPKLSMIGED